MEHHEEGHHSGSEMGHAHHEGLMGKPSHPWLIVIGSFLFFFVIAYFSSMIVPIRFG